MKQLMLTAWNESEFFRNKHFNGRDVSDLIRDSVRGPIQLRVIEKFRSDPIQCAVNHNICFVPFLNDDKKRLIFQQ